MRGLLVTSAAGVTLCNALVFTLGLLANFSILFFTFLNEMH